MLSRGRRDFPLVLFGLPVLENFVGNPFNLTENFGYRNFLCMRTENHVFLPKFLCLTIPKKFVVSTFKFQDICDLENFLSNLEFPLYFCLTVPKNFVRNHLVFQKVSNVKYQKNYQ